MSQYRIILKNKAEIVQWELPYKSALLDWRLNSIHTGTIYVDFVFLRDYLAAQGVTPKNLFESGFTNVYIFREGTLIFAGFVSDVRYQKYTQAFTVEIGIKSWLGYFENRYHTAVYTGVDQGDIAWAAIDATNDIGITEGTITATKNRNRTYSNDDVAKIVVQLNKEAIIDGYYFDISNQKVFTAGPTIGSDRENIIFDEGNIYDFTVGVKLVGGVFTDGIILGGGVGEDQIVRTYDAGSTYEDAWYKQEALINDINVEDTGVLDDKIEQFVELRKNPIRVLTFKTQVDQPLVTLYNVGDRVRVRLPEAEIDELKRIKKKTLFIGESEYVQLEFDYEI